jgi:hypothetical protein
MSIQVRPVPGKKIVISFADDLIFAVGVKILKRPLIARYKTTLPIFDEERDIRQKAHDLAKQLLVPPDFTQESALDLRRPHALNIHPKSERLQAQRAPAL